MSDYGEYKMKSTIIADEHTQARFLLNQIIKKNILEFHLEDESVITGTCSVDIGGEAPGFNSDEKFYLYDVNNNEWILIAYDSIIQMEHISLVG